LGGTLPADDVDGNVLIDLMDNLSDKLKGKVHGHFRYQIFLNKIIFLVWDKGGYTAHK